MIVLFGDAVFVLVDSVKPLGLIQRVVLGLVAPIIPPGGCARVRVVFAPPVDAAPRHDSDSLS